MKVLIIYDSRKMLHKGNYYHTWLDAISSKFNDNFLLDISKDYSFDLIDFELVFFLHSGVNWLEYNVMEALKFNLKSIFKILKLALKVRSKKSIMISKNDFGNFKLKTLIAKILNINHIITHCKESVYRFKILTNKCSWLPYSCNLKRFEGRNKKDKIKFKIGFIGRSNAEVMKSDLRSRLLNNMKDYWGNKVNIRIIDKGDPSLEGEDYVAFLESCEALLNTESRPFHINPRMWEIFACEKVPVCLEGYYEGLIYPYINYLPIKDIHEDSLAELDNLLKNEDLCKRIIINNRFLLKHYSLDACMRSLEEIYRGI